MPRRIPSSQLLTGDIVVLIGILLLQSTTGVADVGAIWRWIPSLFVLLGLWALVRSGFRNVTGPVILIVVAGTIQLLALDLITGDFVAQWWPLIVIAFGLALLLGHWRRQRRAPSTARNDFDLFGVFGGNNQRLTSDAFEGGAATALFGGVEVDLRAVAVADPPAVVSVMALFGGVELHVPEDWSVSFDVLPVFGAAEDERPRFADVEPKATPDLVVTGFAAFGGISVTD